MLSELLLVKDKKMGHKQPRLIPNKSKLIKILFCIFMIFASYIVLRSIVQSNRRELIRDDMYWRTVQMFKAEINTLYPPGIRHKSEYCLTASKFHETELDQINALFEFLNHERNINYFMCFSSLYFTAKVEEYNIYSVVSNSSDYITEAMRYKELSKDKCVETEFDCSKTRSKFSWGRNYFMKFESKIHLCVLNENSSNICSLLTNNFNKNQPKYAHKLRCSYNMWNGEFTLNFDDSSIKLIVHEYAPSIRKSIERRLPSWWTNYADVLDDSEKFPQVLNGEVTLRQGLVEFLFGHEDFDLPSFFFYSKNSRDTTRYNYVSYLNASVRLPADVINYFMIFYSNIWYQ